MRLRERERERKSERFVSFLTAHILQEVILIANKGAPNTVRVAEGMTVKDFLEQKERKEKEAKEEEEEEEGDGVGWKEVNGKIYIHTEFFGLRIFRNLFFFETRPVKEFFTEKTKFILGLFLSILLAFSMSHLMVCYLSDRPTLEELVADKCIPMSGSSLFHFFSFFTHILHEI